MRIRDSDRLASLIYSETKQFKLRTWRAMLSGAYLSIDDKSRLASLQRYRTRRDLYDINKDSNFILFILFNIEDNREFV